MTRHATVLLGALLLTGIVLAPAVAAPVVYIGTLLGDNEVPPVTSTGSGTVAVSYERASHVLTVNVNFSGLQGTVTAAHIHCCVAGPGINAGVATQVPNFPGFPLGVSSGTYAATFDMSMATSYNGSFVTSQGGVPQAEAALTDGMGRRGAYFNVHSSVFPGGEIRAYLIEKPVFVSGFESP